LLFSVKNAVPLEARAVGFANAYVTIKSLAASLMLQGDYKITGRQ
jgi:hypothetical protein